MDSLSEQLKRLIEGIAPDLRAYVWPSLVGRVVRSDATAYRVDVLIGDDDATALALPDVPVAAVFAQAGYGLWALPEVGAEVTISFHDGDVTRPYVESPLWIRNAPPEFTIGTIALVGKKGQKVVLKPGEDEIFLSAGTVTIEGADSISLGGSAATDPVVKGNALHSVLSSLCSALQSIPSYDPILGVSPAFAAAVMAVAAQLSSFKSGKVTTA